MREMLIRHPTEVEQISIYYRTIERQREEERERGGEQQGYYFYFHDKYLLE